MFAWSVAPTAIVVRERWILRTEVCGGDDDGAWQAPFRVVDTTYLVARSTSEASVEKRGAKSSCAGTIALLVQVAIATSST